MKEKIVFMLFLISIIIISAMIGKKRSLEYFTSNTNTNNWSNNSVLLKKSFAYYPHVLTHFMTDHASNRYATISCMTGSALNANCVPLKIFKFNPSVFDTSCSLRADLGSSCSNFYIDNHTTHDPYYYDSPQVCTSINASVGKPQSDVRILNNNYTFAKRCINLKTPTIVNAGGTGDTAFYKMTCDRNVELFMLLRPCMILFPQCGLFAFRVFSQGVTPASGTSAATTPGNAIRYSNLNSNVELFITKVTEPKISPQLDSPMNVTNLSGKQLFPTIYYFNYLEPSDKFANDIPLNTMTLIFDKKSTSKLIPTTVSTGATDNICTQIKLDWAPTTGQFKVTLGASQQNECTFEVHPDFTSKIAAAASANTRNSFHVIFTYTVDMVIIVGLYKDLSNSSSRPLVTMVKGQAANMSSPIFLQYPQSIPTSSYRTGNESVCPPSAIPNFALIAKDLGYSFI